MTETTTPTEGEVIDTSGVDQSTLPDNDGADNSAVESTDDTEQQEDNSSDNQDSTTETNDNELDPSLAKFAKSQGFEPDNLTDGEKKALKIAHDNQKAYRQRVDAAKPSEIEKTIKAIDSDSDMSDREYTDFKLGQQNMILDIRQYWAENPDDKQYEKEAIAILQREKELYGEAAQTRLVGDMPRLMREAKFAAGAYDPQRIREQAQREERERLRREQEGAADGLNATDTSPDAGSVDMREWIRNEYDPSNEEHIKKLNEYTQSILK